MIYFDNNATAPVMREAREAWLNVTEKVGGNPSSMHQAGTRAAIALAGAREKLAAFLGCHPLDLIWTSGATEANNMVTHHFAKTLGAQDEIWISAIEHLCVHVLCRGQFMLRYTAACRREEHVVVPHQQCSLMKARLSTPLT